MAELDIDISGQESKTLDRHYEQLRLDMQLVFHDLGIAA
jgi:hypothetical protein